jgi:alkylation response protein AidB-like acyl-CoA dehydrogenase
MDLDFTEEQNMLRETLRELCNAYAPPEVVRAAEDDPTGYPTEFWTQLAKLGLLGLTLPERWHPPLTSSARC